MLAIDAAVAGHFRLAAGQEAHEPGAGTEEALGDLEGAGQEPAGVEIASDVQQRVEVFHERGDRCRARVAREREGSAVRERREGGLVDGVCRAGDPEGADHP